MKLNPFKHYFFGKSRRYFEQVGLVKDILWYLGYIKGEIATVFYRFQMIVRFNYFWKDTKLMLCQNLSQKWLVLRMGSNRYAPNFKQRKVLTCMCLHLSKTGEVHMQ